MRRTSPVPFPPMRAMSVGVSRVSRGDLTGLGASRGTARGATRVVGSLNDLAAIQPGDVLGANNIHPGWTSVFPLLAGLITETGGILSHGAILAREYGSPR
jgi:pyruvate,water dikinase